MRREMTSQRKNAATGGRRREKRDFYTRRAEIPAEMTSIGPQSTRRIRVQIQNLWAKDKNKTKKEKKAIC